MLPVLIATIVLVHLHLEYRVWVGREVDVFRKYRPGGSSLETLEVAKRAYLAKAAWLVSLILLQYAGIGFKEALVYSFAGYAILVPALLRFNRYSLAQLLLALACLAWLLARK